MSTADILRQQGADVRLVMKSTKEQRRNSSGAVIAGAGGTAAAGGLVGGGIPGVKSKVLPHQAEGSRMQRGRATLASARGGIFGFRTDAHRGFLQQETDAANKSKPTTRVEHFVHGRGAGKIGPEKEIIRHLKVGRVGSNVALVGGAGAAAYGVHRMRNKKVSKARKDTDRYFGTALGAGATAAAGSAGGAHLLEHEGRKWAKRSGDSVEGARKIIPRLGGTATNGRSPNPRVPDVRPQVQTGKVIREPQKFLSGHSSAKAEAAGKLHGAAAQQRHFAGVYGHMGNQVRRIRNPALAVAAVGGGGLALSHRKRKRVKKSYTAGQMSILRSQGIDPISKASFAGMIENLAVTTGLGVTAADQRKRKRKKVQKSLVNGKWLKSSQALDAYKKGQKVGGYAQQKGMTPAHKEIKEQTEAGSDWMKTVRQNPQKSHPTLGMLGLHGLAVRTGGKNTGKSTVLINPQAIARNSKGKRDYRKNKKMVLTHEHAHAEAKRSQYRSHQLNASDTKMGREEGRADYLSQGHHSGYKTPLERSYLDNAPNKEFGAAYKDVQNRMHRAGTKVRKSFPRASV